MRYDPHKSYGYPVLRPCDPHEVENSDYENHRFNPSFSGRVGPTNVTAVTIEVEPYLTVDTLKVAISEKKARLIAIVECRETFYTGSFDIAISGGTIEIEGDRLHGKVFVSLYVVAEEKFELKSNEFHKDFHQKVFDIEKYAILAESAPSEFIVYKENYRNPRSIMQLDVNNEIPDGDFVISLDNDYIEIAANETLNAKVSSWSSTSGHVMALSTVFVPALTYALNQLDGRPELLEYKWAQIITNQLEQIEKDEKIRPENYNKAHALFRKPLLKLDIGDSQ